MSVKTVVRAAAICAGSFLVLFGFLAAVVLGHTWAQFEQCQKFEETTSFATQWGPISGCTTVEDGTRMRVRGLI